MWRLSGGCAMRSWRAAFEKLRDSATAAILYAGIAALGVSGLEPGTSQWLGYASLAALITGGLLMLMLTGPGRYSFDRR